MNICDFSLPFLQKESKSLQWRGGREPYIFPIESYLIEIEKHKHTMEWYPSYPFAYLFVCPSVSPKFSSNWLIG